MSLDSKTVAALTEALEDEYKVRASYAAVIETFGPVRPFANIIKAEDRHAAALERIFVDHGLPVPPDRWLGHVAAPESLAAALAASVEGEIADKTLYDRLMAATTNPRVLRVFDHLRRASRDNHLPAFRRALAHKRDAAAPAGKRTAIESPCIATPRSDRGCSECGHSETPAHDGWGGNGCRHGRGNGHGGMHGRGR